MSIEAMKQALEALECGLDYAKGEQFENSQRFKGYEHLAPNDADSVKQIEDAITSLRQAIAEAEKQEKSAECVGEPVAWESVLGAVARGWCYEENANKTMDSELAVAIAKEVHALYTTPQQRKPLTDEQLKNHYQNNEWLDGVRFAEQFHGIKE